MRSPLVKDSLTRRSSRTPCVVAAFLHLQGAVLDLKPNTGNLLGTYVLVQQAMLHGAVRTGCRMTICYPDRTMKIAHRSHAVVHGTM